MFSKLVPVPSGSMIPDRDIGKRPILECISLGITFGGLKAVEDFNLTIGRTEIAGLIGPNGAGKTTVFNLLTKVYQPTKGTILLDGTDTHGMDTMKVNRAGIARTFQNIRLFQDLSVEDNVKVGMDTQMRYSMWSGIIRLPGYWKEEKVAHERAFPHRAGSVLYPACGAAQVRRLPHPGVGQCGDRPGAGHQSLTAAAGRTGGGHEPLGDGGADGEHPQDPGHLPDRRTAD